MSLIVEAIRKVVERQNLTRLEAAGAMEAIMSGGASNAQIAAFLTALRMTGETGGGLSGLAQGMREKVVGVRAAGTPCATLSSSSGIPVPSLADTERIAAGTFNV